MSQRLHNCINNTNMDTIHNDYYATRLQKRGKPDSGISRLCQQTKRERSVSRNRPVGTVHNPNLPVSRAKSTNVRPVNELKSESTAPNIIHRELYTDNPALVEVTVKTHNAKPQSQANSRSTSRSRSREPWSKLLKHRTSNESLSCFNSFDPLRTIHFLAKELQTKLIDSNDRTVQQMVTEMQQALNRVPPEIASTVMLNSSREHQIKKSSYCDFKQKSKSSCNEREELPEKSLIVVKAPTQDRGCQTLKNNYEAEKLQKHLEESSVKIETACKQMEAVCTRLKSEKEELEIMLRAERETVKFLRKQMEDYDSEKTESASNKITALQQERDNLQAQVKKLKLQLDAHQNMSSIELKTLVQDLRKQKAEADEEVALLNHQLTLVSMEKEKYVAILSARDRQIKEIRCEMSQLQEVVNEQLVELQNAPCSVPSSATNMSSEQQSWLPLKSDGPKKNEVSDNLTPSSMNTNESTLEQLFLKDKIAASSFKELPSGDSSGTTVIEEVKKAMKLRKEAIKKQQKIAEIPPSIGTMGMSETHANIRDMFAKIKEQAMMVAIPDQQKTNDIDTFQCEQALIKKST